MKPAVRQTRSYLMDLFARHGFHPRTDFGQNFLIDGGIQRRIVETYDYDDEDGKLLYQVVRYEPKDFRQRKPDGAPSNPAVGTPEHEEAKRKWGYDA